VSPKADQSGPPRRGARGAPAPGREAEAPLAGYEVLLAVTGGIACYKSAYLTSQLVQAGAGVTVAMTASAEQFIAPLTFQTLSARPVYRSLWQATEDWKSGHISLSERADLFVIAPATANILAKMACGLADDLVSSLALAAGGECPILVAPAMNTRMWNAPPTRDNMKRLRSWGVLVVGPGEGFLACRATGAGRMAEPAEIFDTITKILKKWPPKGRGQK
jgi:phosphopantothenoylcysteine decarboxylase/phosphopantothenate--cysteine ligase